VRQVLHIKAELVVQEKTADQIMVLAVVVVRILLA
jgi:hypothetical protein